MDDECIALLRERDTWYVPTLAISHLTASQATNAFEADWVAERGLSPALCCRAEAASGVHATWFRKALDAGVRMALGSDIRTLKNAALLEMGLWVRDGATPWQTLLAATRNGAAVCGVGDQLGTVEVGKLADLIVVAANPLDDITNVRRLQLVLKEGRVVSDKRDPRGAV
jgi:imidazolonepropionase-like amidohydrolase